VLTKIEVNYMTKKLRLVDKAKRILIGVETDFELCFLWDDDFHDTYYRYFSHPDHEIRKYSLLIFAGGLGNWHLQSAYIFNRDLNRDKEYIFEDYVKSFLVNKETIRKEFPLLYRRLAWYLLRLDNRKPFDSMFTSYITYESYIDPNKKLFNDLRHILIESGVDFRELPNNHEDIMKEVGLAYRPY
jgi:hypothetical protein